MKRFQNIGIFFNSNGLTVKVGCTTLVYQQTQLDMFHNDLALYLNNPLAAEKEVRERWNIDQSEDAESPTEERSERASIKDFKKAETEERDHLEKILDKDRREISEIV